MRARRNFRKELIRIVYGERPEDVAEMTGMTAERRAQIALRQELLFHVAQGRPLDEIANEYNIRESTVTRLLGDAIEALFAHHAQATPRDNFARYAAFNLGIIRKLDDLVAEFMEDKENRQYSAAVTALKAQSDLYDKVIERGAKLGIIQERKAGKEVNQSREDLLETLRTERGRMDLLIEELEVTTRRRARLVRQGANGGGGRVISQVASAQNGDLQAPPDVGEDGTGHEAPEPDTTGEAPDPVRKRTVSSGKRKRLSISELAIKGPGPDTG